MTPYIITKISVVWGARSRCLLDCDVLKGFGMYMIGILGRLYWCIEKSQLASPVCSSLVNIKGLESTFFLFLPLTKLPHPNTIYRPGVGSWVLASELY